MSKPFRRRVKVQVELPMRLVAAMDHIAIDVRLRHGAVFSRSAIIRALVDLAEAKTTRMRKPK
jgi:hypothetical protein